MSRPRCVMFVCATSGSRKSAAKQRFLVINNARIGCRYEDGPGGAGNTVILGLTTTEEWLMWIVFHALGGVA